MGGGRLRVVVGGSTAVLSFETVREILRCFHSLKLNLFSRTLQWYYMFFRLNKQLFRV